MQVFAQFVIVLFGFVHVTTSLQDSHHQISLHIVPSVILHVKSKRKAITLHGKSEFDIYATPIVSVNGTSIRYNSYAKFDDGNMEFIYTLVDGAIYLTTKDASNVTTVQCLSPSLLPFDKILPALNNVIPIPSASIGDVTVDCASGNLFKTSFLGVPYAICGSGQAGFTAFSSDLEISVTYLDELVSIVKPEQTNGSALCESIETTTLMTPTALALATGDNIPSSISRMLKAESHMAMQASHCKSKSTPRPCIVFHGLGNAREKAELQDTPKLVSDRLGSINGHAPFCSTVKYSILDTLHAGWRNTTLQQKYCDQILSMSPTSNTTTKTVSDTIVVTHSMAGLVMASALANGKCKFSLTTSWVSLSSPMAGSKASDFAINACSDHTIHVEVELLQLIGQCPVATSRKSTVRSGGKHSSSVIEKAYAAAQKAYRENVDAIMCSDHFVGLLSQFQAPCILAGTVIPHNSLKNDGLVELESCLGDLDPRKFSRHYTNKFYKARLNHADTAFLAGDGWLSDAQKPVKWFQCLQL